MLDFRAMLTSGGSGETTPGSGRRASASGRGGGGTGGTTAPRDLGKGAGADPTPPSHPRPPLSRFQQQLPYFLI